MTVQCIVTVYFGGNLQPTAARRQTSTNGINCMQQQKTVQWCSLQQRINRIKWHR